MGTVGRWTEANKCKCKCRKALLAKEKHCNWLRYYQSNEASGNIGGANLKWFNKCNFDNWGSKSAITADSERLISFS